MGRNRQDQRSLKEDERAIEGLPIRLVIALFVGVASLVLMLQVLGLFSNPQPSELTVNVTEGTVVDEGESQPVKFRVVGGGEPAPEVPAVTLEPGTARGETVKVPLPGNKTNATISDFTAKTGADLGPNQDTGTYIINPINPSGNDAYDQVQTAKITIINS